MKTQRLLGFSLCLFALVGGAAPAAPRLPAEMSGEEMLQKIVPSWGDAYESAELASYEAELLSRIREWSIDGRPDAHAKAQEIWDHQDLLAKALDKPNTQEMACKVYEELLFAHEFASVPLPPESLQKIAAAAKSASLRPRVRALSLLERMATHNPKEGAEILIGALKAPNREEMAGRDRRRIAQESQLRAQAAKHLQKYDSPAVRSALKAAAANDPSDEVRANALYALVGREEYLHFNRPEELLNDDSYNLLMNELKQQMTKLGNRSYALGAEFVSEMPTGTIAQALAALGSIEPKIETERRKLQERIEDALNKIPKYVKGLGRSDSTARSELNSAYRWIARTTGATAKPAEREPSTH
jgi:hypothetical protein